MAQEKPNNRIEVRLRDLGQLFNTMDPSPFHEKDLDHDAEEFIESWAREFPADAPLVLNEGGIIAAGAAAGISATNTARFSRASCDAPPAMSA